MHLPEKWGMLQFSSDTPGSTPFVRNPEWTVRSVAMVLYYAEYAYQGQYGVFTDDIKALQEFANPPVLLGSCAAPITVQLGRSRER